MTLPRWFCAAGSILALAMCTSGLRADPLKLPRRVVNGRTVDLMPLISWWTNHNGDRPLTAWVHVTGTIVATNSMGWTVRGVAEKRSDGAKEGEKAAGSSHDVFILKSPPVQDQVKFAQLLAAREQAAAAISADKRQLGTVNAKQPRPTRRNMARMQELKQEAGDLKEAENEAETQLKALDKQLQGYGIAPGTAGTKPPYKVDCFALDMNEELKGVPVYNHGGSFY